MKNTFLRILSLFFLTILLSSNFVNLHVLFHNHTSIEVCHNHSHNNSDDNTEKESCQLCVITQCLNHLNYHLDFNSSFQPETTTDCDELLAVSSYSKFFYDKNIFSHNKNKAPPYLT